MKKALKVAGFGIGVVFVIFTLLLAAVYFGLKSPSATQKLLSYVKPMLQENGITLELASMKIDLLSSVRLDKVNVAFNIPDSLIGSVAFDKIDIQYDLGSLLSKKLIVDHVRVLGIEVDLNLSGKTSAEEEPKPESEPFDIVGFLEEPPMELELNDMEMSSSGISFKLSQPNTQMNVWLPSFDLKAALTLNAGALNLSHQLNVAEAEEGKRLTVELSTQRESQVTQLSLENYLTSQSQISLVANEGKVDLKINPVKLETLVRRIKVGLQNNDTQSVLNLEVPEIKLDTSIDVESGMIDPTAKDPISGLFPLSLDISQSLGIPKVSLKMSNSAASTQVDTDFSYDGVYKLTIHSTTDMEKNLIEVFDAALKLRGIKLRQQDLAAKSIQNIAVGKVQLTLKGDKDADYKLATKLGVQDINLPKVLSKNSHLELTQLLTITPNFRNLTLGQDIAFNKLKLASLSHKVTDTPDKTEVDQMIRLRIPSTLNQHIENLAILNKVGSWNGSIELQTALGHGSSSILAATDADLENMPIQSNFQITLTQEQRPQKSKALVLAFNPIAIYGRADLEAGRPKVSMSLTTEKLQALVYKIKTLQLDLGLDLPSQDNLNLSLNTSVGRIWLPQLGQRIDFGTELELITKNQFKDVLLKDKVTVNQIQVLDLNLSLQDKENRLQTQAQVDINVSPELGKGVKKVKAAEILGHIQSQIKLALNLTHPQPTIQTLSEKDLSSMELDSQVTMELSQPATPANTLPQRIILNKPISLANITKLKSRELTNSLQLSVPSFEMAPKLLANDIQIESRTEIDNIETLNSILATAKGSIKGVTLSEFHGKDVDPSEFLQNIGFDLKSDLQQSKVLNLEHFALRVGKLLKFGTAGKVSLDSQNGSLKGFATITAPATFPKAIKGSATGSVKIPWNIAIEKGKRFLVDGSLNFNDFSVNIEKPHVVLKKLDGSALFKEEVALTNDGQIAFSYLLEQNPFERVDFSRQQHLLSSASLYFERFEFNNIAIGPLRSNIAIEQNMLNLHKFDLNLLDGSVSGEMALDMHPKQLSVRLLSRVTNIKPKLLTSGKGKEKPDEVSLRTAIIYNVNEALMEGRIDINKIGGDQLIALINVIDPNYEDDQLNSARSALNLAYPTYVGILMQQGMMDMDIELSLAGVGKDIAVRKVPLYSFVASATEDLVKTINEVPIQ